jgi:hypothetical protein
MAFLLGIFVLLDSTTIVYRIRFIVQTNLHIQPGCSTEQKRSERSWKLTGTKFAET